MTALLTALGLFLCPGLVCTRTPHAGLEGYWQNGRLYVVAQHKAFAVLDCVRLVTKDEESDTWRCA